MAEPRKLIKLGKYTYAVTLPIEVVRHYGWRAKQKVVVTDKGNGRIEVRDWRKGTRADC